MSTNLKHTRIFDLNLFTGSSDSMRQELKGVHYNASGLAFEDASDNQQTIAYSGYGRTLENLDENNFGSMPFLRYSTVFFGYNENIRSDEEWAKYFIGGTFADTNYSGIYNTRVYSDHFIDGRILPYKPSETTQLNDTIEPNIVLTTEFYQYYKRYQNHVANLESELMIPNFYFINYDLFDVSIDDTNFPRFQYRLLEDYLNNTFVNEEKDVADYGNLKNLFLINTDFIEDKNIDTRATNSNYVANEEDLSKKYSLMPFANKIEIGQELTSTGTDHLFKNIITNRGYEFKFLKILKEVFQEEISLRPATVNFGISVTEQKSISSDSYGTFENTNTIPLRILDLPTAFVYTYKNAVSETSDNFVIDAEDYEEQVDVFSDSTGKQRHLVIDKTLEVFNDIRNLMKENFENQSFYDISQLQKFLNKANETKYYETMAFRVEKIGGLPTGDARTQNTVQNIWFLNKQSAIKYVDTQVKYGTQYTYNIYSYVLVQGYKYQFSDLAVSRELSIREAEDRPTVYCLELYDPQTGQNVAKKGARQFVSPSTAAQVSEIRQAQREASSKINNLNSAYSRNYGFLQNLAYGLPAEGYSIPYLTSSVIVDGEQYDDYLFVGETAVSGAIELFALFNSEVDDDLSTRTTEEEALRASLLDSYYSDVVSYATYDNKAELTAEANLNKDVIESLSSSISDTIEELNEILETLDPFSDIDESSLFTDSQVLTETPYVAELRISIEPSLKIIEIPLEQKSMTIIDHPPNDLVVTPYHLVDQSNSLAFYMKYDTFSANTEPYPVTINQIDSSNEEAYKIGKDFVSTSKTQEEAVSPPRFIEVYRSTSKPSSYESFAGLLRKTIDLKNDSGDIVSDVFFKESVEVNKKYYYTFRVVSELGVSGEPSPIFESELINDGGYVYGSFNQLSVSDLSTPAPKNPLLSFKKLINIVPNIRHLTMNTSAEMFENSSLDEIGNIQLGDQSLLETIWDQKFKIRLTSKKTGRKIDLNLKFEKKVSK